MKVLTLTQTVVVESAIKPTEVLRRLFAAFLVSAWQKPRQDVAKKKRAKAPRAGRMEPRHAGSCVMLVESDIRRNARDIMP
jgi:hypothetical protein